MYVLIKQYEKKREKIIIWRLNETKTWTGHIKRSENEKNKYVIRWDELRRRRIDEMGWGDKRRDWKTVEEKKRD